jgi:GT2 family glycosyltransferase
LIAFLDDDDQWLEDKLKHQVEILSRHPEVDVLFTDFRNENLITGERGAGFVQTIRGLEKLNTEEIEKDVFLIKDKFPHGIMVSNFILPSSTIIRKEVLKTVGIFNEKLRNSLDLEYWWRIYLHGYSFAYFNKILVGRTKPAESLSSPSVETYQNTLKCLDSCRDITAKRGRQDLISLMNKSYPS